MKKSELKDGMKLVLKNGDEYLLIYGTFLVALTGEHKDGFINLSSYDDDLNYKFKEIPVSKEYEIINVFEYKIGKRWVKLPKSTTKLVQLDQKLTIKVVILGNKTTVLLPDGTEASTTCLPEDKYDEEKGIQIATIKAMMKHQAKRLKELTE